MTELQRKPRAASSSEQFPHQLSCPTPVRLNPSSRISLANGYPTHASSTPLESPYSSSRRTPRFRPSFEGPWNNAEIIFTDAFPADGKRVEFSRNAVLSAALDLKDKDILHRINCEPSYLKEITKPVRFGIITTHSLTISFSGKLSCQPVLSRSQTSSVTDYH